MNRERAKELLPIIQAYAEGKEVQIKFPFSSTWENIEDPEFIHESAKYRIKPEPREIYVTEYDAGRLSDVHWDSREEAGIPCGSRVVKFREVTEDE